MKKDILSEALEDVLNEAYEETTGLDIPDYEYSDDFLEKMNELTQAPREENSRRKKGIIWKTCSALAAAAAIFCVAYGLRNAPKPQKDGERTDIVSEEQPTVQSATEPVVTTASAEDYSFATGTKPPEAMTTAAASSQGIVCTTARATSPAVSPGSRTTAAANKPSGGGSASTGTSPSEPPPTTKPADDGLQQQIDEYERSIIMKKFLAATAAAATAFTVTPTNVLAEYKAPEVSSADAAVFALYDSGELNADIDGNGVFDAQDVFFVHNYIQSPYQYNSEEIAKIKANCDLDRDGSLTKYDVETFARYYLCKNGFNAGDFDMFAYKNKEDAVTVDSYTFTQTLMSAASDYDLSYQFFANKINKENIDLDFNSSGAVDVYDIFDYYMYSFCEFYGPGKTGIFELDYMSNSFKSVNEVSLWDLMDESTVEKCAAFRETFSYNWNSDEELIKYFIYNCDFDVNYLDRNLYKAYGDKLGEKVGEDVYSHLSKSMDTVTASFSYQIKNAAVGAGLAKVRDDTAKIELEPEFDDKFWECFDAYEEAILNGEVPPPDVNGDGAFDKKDNDAVITYMGDIINYLTAEESTLDFKTWNYIDTQLDINHDGICGDIYDIWIVSTLQVKYGDSLTPKLQEYAEKQALAAVRYMSFLEDKSGLTVSRSGDVDGNGQLKINDAVMVLQSISNPDKFSLSETSAFSADVYATGDGVTPMDALQIQRELLELE